MNSEQLARFVRKTNNGMKFLPVMIIVLVVAGVMFITVPMFNKAKHGGGPSPVSILKQLALGNLMYAMDNDDRLPLASRWMDDIQPYTKNELLLIDPLLEDRKEGEYGFAMFEPVSRVVVSSVLDPDSVPLVFQSTLLQKNAASDLTTLPSPPRNGKTNAVAFLDGHAKMFKSDWPETPIVLIIKPDLGSEEGADEE